MLIAACHEDVPYTLSYELAQNDPCCFQVMLMHQTRGILHFLTLCFAMND